MWLGVGIIQKNKQQLFKFNSEINYSLLEKLSESSENNIKNLNISNIKFLFSNPRNFFKKNNKYDAIFIFGGVEFIPKNILELLKENGGRLITVLYKDSDKLGRIYLIKKIRNKISAKFYIEPHTPILEDFKKNKKEFIF